MRSGVRALFRKIQESSSQNRQKVSHAQTSKEAELKPEVTETIRSITWKKQKDKIAEWDGSDKPEYYGRCSKDQCDLSPTTGVLVMKGLKREDEWTYSAEINGKTSQEEFLVTVLDPVSKPIVTTSCNETQCILTCVGEETKHTKYSWKENNETVKEGNTLMVEKSGEQSKSYTCVFSNPKSEEHTFHSYTSHHCVHFNASSGLRVNS
uniref:Ig-like domain-containing protein n=1 Tax=Scleropages formosus TaxID=113540 RepID=A0A8C9SYI6_SCLFO